MKCKIIDCTQGSAMWHEARLGRATASQAANILTPTGKLSTSATGLIRRLAREQVCADPNEREPNAAMEWGNMQEPFARDEFRKLSRLRVIEVGFCQSLVHPALGCSPDGLIQDADGPIVAGLEIKCPQIDTHVEYLIDDVLPKKYAPQVHWSMAVTGLDVWYFMSYFPNLRSLIVKVERDDYTEKIESAALEFAERYQSEVESIIERILP
jgi:predicted phage-related endonuclease